MNKPAKIFISYAHDDSRYYDYLVEHLRGLERLGIATVWGDRKIRPGDNWSKLLDDKIEETDIFLFLISSKFFSSDYCYQIEMTRALARQERDEAKAIPILVDDCDWVCHPIAKLQAAHDMGKPLRESRTRSKTLAEISEKLRRLIDEKVAPESRSATSSSQDSQACGTPHLLIDRKPQMITLKTEFSHHLNKRSQYPFVFLTQGESVQCSDILIDRFVDEVVKSKLGCRPTMKPWDPAADLSQGPHDQGDSSAWTDLKEVLKAPANGVQNNARAEISVFLSSQRQPMLLRMSLSSQQLYEQGEKWLPGFCSFWDSWPRITDGYGPLCVLNIIYPDKDAARREKVAAKTVRKWIAGLKTASESETLTFAIPEELDHIYRHEVEAWFGLYASNNTFSLRVNTRIREIIEDQFRSNRSISMFALTQALGPLFSAR